MYSVADETRKPIFEGVQGENEARSIEFDITPWVEELGNGACTATAKRPTDTTPYPVTVTRSGNVVTWKPDSTDTAIEGLGAFQLSFSIDGVVAKTRIWNTKIAPSLVGAGDPPDPYDDWLQDLRDIAADALQDAQDADASAQDAEAWAKGTKNGTPVPSTADQYENNSKYYSEESYKNAEAWAVGQRGGVDVPSTDPAYENNAKYWAEQSLANQYGAYIVKSASGEIASFSDGADDVPMKSLNVTITPKQSGSGDPSPSNVRPITGWTVVNVNVESANIIKTPYIGGASAYGVNFTKNDDGSVHAAGTPTHALSWIFDNSIKLKGGARYTFGYFGDMPNMNEWRLQIYSSQTATLYGFIRKSSPTLVIEPTKDDTVSVYFDTSSGTVGRAVDFTVQPVLVHGEMPAAYALYTGHTTPVPLGQTVYGGEVNPISGELKNGYGIATLNGSESWTDDPSGGWHRYRLTKSDMKQVWAINAVDIVCNIGKQGRNVENAIMTYGNYIYFYSQTITTVADFKTMLNSTPMVVAYELATPTTVQLTPAQVASLLGNNNVWADCGAVEVEYRADPTLAYNELAQVIVSLGGNL